MISKIIHYGWFGDQAKKPVARIESWKIKLPDYEFKEWNESNADIDSHKFSRIAYDAGSYGPAFDPLRLDFLYQYGGIWLDTDVLVHENLDPFLDYSFFIGFDSHACFNCGVFGSEAHHPLLEKTQRWLDSMSTHLRPLTKEQVATQVIQRGLGIGGSLYLQIKRLYGIPLDTQATTIGDRIRIEPMPTFTIRGDYGMKNYTEHLYEGQWYDHCFDYPALLKVAYEKHGIVDVWKAYRTGHDT